VSQDFRPPCLPQPILPEFESKLQYDVKISLGGLVMGQLKDHPFNGTVSRDRGQDKPMEQ
jgi:hypothetical protein